MAQAAIDNPVINSPFSEPNLHFRVVDGQVTGELEQRRQPSEFFVPDRLHAATIEITNYYTFIRREKVRAASLTKKILAGPAPPSSSPKEHGPDGQESHVRQAKKTRYGDAVVELLPPDAFAAFDEVEV